MIRTFCKTVVYALLTSAASLVTAQLHAQVPLGEPVESILRWTPDQQLERYRAIEKVYETRTIKRGEKVAPLPIAKRELKLSVDWQDKTLTIEDFMKANRMSGVLVLKDGSIVLERYAFDRKSSERWTSFSVAKSVTSTLVGVAIADGYVAGLDAPVANYVTELKDTAYDGVTVRQMLTMTSGVKWIEDYTDPNSDVVRASTLQVAPGRQPVLEYMRKLPRDTPPGTKFNYKTGETDLVGILVARATGKSLADYLSEKIWRPYGMEQDAIWIVDRAHQERGGYGISMTLRDYARFGQFMLDGGRAGGKQVLPKDWTRLATVNQVPKETLADVERAVPGYGYGYFWWTQPDSFEANGIFGQTVKVFPRDRLVIAVNSAMLNATGSENNAAMAALFKAVRAAQ
jgi:CubicO group peptidase (beta-lactamase class C family)